MATYSQTSGELHLAAVTGDSLSAQVDFNPTNLSGYTVTADILSLVTGHTVATASVTLVSPTAGIVSIAMQREQTAALPVGTYAWRMQWVAPGNVRRTALSGTLDLRPR